MRVCILYVFFLLPLNFVFGQDSLYVSMKDYVGLQAQIRSQKDTIVSLNAELVELKNNSKKNEGKNRNRKRKEPRKVRLKKEKNELQKKLDGKDKELKETKNKLSETEKKLREAKGCESKRKQLEKTINSKKQEVTKLEEEIKKKNEELTTCNEEKAKNNSELVRFKSWFENQIIALEKKVNSYTNNENNIFGNSDVSRRLDSQINDMLRCNLNTDILNRIKSDLNRFVQECETIRNAQNLLSQGFNVNEVSKAISSLQPSNFKFLNTKKLAAKKLRLLKGYCDIFNKTSEAIDFANSKKSISAKIEILKQIKHYISGYPYLNDIVKQKELNLELNLDDKTNSLKDIECP